MTRYLLCVFVLVAPVSASANGFVKGPGQHYSKVGLALERPATFGPGPEAYREEGRVVSVYSEVGLPLPWASQVSVYVPWKTIIRRSVAEGDTLESASFADARLGFRFSLGTPQTFFEGSSWPLSVHLASETQLVLPTTPETFREGNEQRRASKAPEGASFLVAGVDRGLSRWSQGLGLSLSSGALWLSSRVALTQDLRPGSPEHLVAFELGHGLPWNSWVQAGFERIGALANEEPTQADPAAAPVATESASRRAPAVRLKNQFRAGIGVTIWDGLALEAGYSQSRPQPSDLAPIQSQWQLGVSYRSL